MRDNILLQEPTQLLQSRGKHGHCTWRRPASVLWSTTLRTLTRGVDDTFSQGTSKS